MGYFWSYPPYVPTPENIVQRMLEIAKVGPGDIVYDLGCGDGRILIQAVNNFGAKCAVGYEIKDERFELASRKVAEAGLSERITIRKENFFNAEIGNATVITLYLTQATNDALKTKLSKETRSGTRIVSHYFDIPEWKSDFIDEFGGRKVFLYITPRAFKRKPWKLF